MNDGWIRVRTGEPDYINLSDTEFSWADSVDGDAMEILPNDAPTPKGKPVVLTTYVDANLMHDVVTG